MEVSGKLSEEEGQLGAFSDSLSQQALTPASGSQGFISEIKRLRFCYKQQPYKPSKEDKKHLSPPLFCVHLCCFCRLVHISKEVRSSGCGVLDGKTGERVSYE